MNHLNAEAIFAAASQLPEADRLALVTRLLENMPGEGLTLSLDDADLAAELDRRRADEDGAVPWSQLQAEES